MAAILVENHKTGVAPASVYYCDAYTDLGTIINARMGDAAYIMSGDYKGKVFMMLSSGSWEIQN